MIVLVMIRVVMAVFVVLNGDCETTGNGGRGSDTKDNLQCGA